MKVYIEAYDAQDRQILGNLDGQGVINAKQYKRTKHYKALSTFRTLNNRVTYYKIVSESGFEYEKVWNQSWRIKSLDITEQSC